MITKNEIKYYASLKQKKYRQTEGKFLIEGFHLLEECVNSAYFLECVLISENTNLSKNSKLLGILEDKKTPVFYVKDNLFEKIAETENSQGISAVVHKKKDYNINLLLNSKLIVALDKINDPGNLGTILRTAYWFGADSVVIGENSVDLYNPKVLRSTQGAVFHLNFFENILIEKILSDLFLNGFNVYLLDVKAVNTLEIIEKNKKTVFVFGNEAEGISDVILKGEYNKIRIEGYSNCESLNVAVSCGIVLNNFKRGNIK